jgi:acetylornithine deacetylase
MGGWAAIPADGIDAALDALLPAAIDLLEGLVAVNSTSPSFMGVVTEDVIGGETICSCMIGAYLVGAGFDLHEVAPDPRPG